MSAALDLCRTRLTGRLHIEGVLRFETAWRVGSGKEGDTLSDLGVMLDPDGVPILPGSSLKGKLRNTCESLAHALGLKACFLDAQAGDFPQCVSDPANYHQLRPDYKSACDKGVTARVDWIKEHTCDVCSLFGSPLCASRIRMSDGLLDEWAGVVQVRDGVVLDRDSHTAVDGLKYDYEVVPADTSFRIRIDVENQQADDLALLGAALFEWHAGLSLGGFTSRGLGRAQLDGIKVKSVSFEDRAQRLRYLTNADPDKRWTDVDNWQEYCQHAIEAHASAKREGE